MDTLFGLLVLNMEALIILATVINMEYEKASNHILELLKTRLSPLLFYHSYEHTLSVLKAVIEISWDENIQSHEDLILLKTAAVYHDCGFLNTYEIDSEEESCKIAKEILPEFDYNSFQIESVCKLIMKTKMPQTPETLLEKILCDADLNYLGQDDFIIIGNKLLRELNAMGKNISEKEWNKLQIDFLEAHHYWTSSVISKRENKKAEHLQRLWQIVKDY